MDPVEYYSQGGAHHQIADIDDGDVHVAKRLTISSRPVMMQASQQVPQSILSSPPPPPPAGALPAPPATLPRQQYQPRQKTPPSRPRPKQQQPRIITPGSFVEDISVGGSIPGDMTMSPPGSRNYEYNRLESSAWHSPEQEFHPGRGQGARGARNRGGVNQGVQSGYHQQYEQTSPVQQWDDLRGLNDIAPGGNAFAVGYGQGIVPGGHPAQYDQYGSPHTDSPRSAGTQGSMDLEQRHFRGPPGSHGFTHPNDMQYSNAPQNRPTRDGRAPTQRPRNTSDAMSPIAPDSYRGDRRPPNPPSSRRDFSTGDRARAPSDPSAVRVRDYSTPRSKARRPSEANHASGYSPTYDVLYTAQREFERSRDGELSVDPGSRRRAGSGRRPSEGPSQRGERANSRKRAPRGAPERSNGPQRYVEAEQAMMADLDISLERPGPLVSEESYARGSSPTIATIDNPLKDEAPGSPEKIDSAQEPSESTQMYSSRDVERAVPTMRFPYDEHGFYDGSGAEANDTVADLPRSNSQVRPKERPVSISPSLASRVSEERTFREPLSTRASTSTLAPPVIEKRASTRFSLLKRLSGMNLARSSSSASSSRRGTLGRTSTRSSAALSPLETTDLSPLDTTPPTMPAATTHRTPSARASLTSLPDLILRAGRLANNLDRGRTASRLGMMDWLSAAPDSSRATSSSALDHETTAPSSHHLDPSYRALQHTSDISSTQTHTSAAGTSDIIASFPPPSAGIAGPNGFTAARGRAPSSGAGGAPLTLTPSLSFFRNDLLPRGKPVPRGSFLLGSTEALPAMIGPDGMKIEGPFSGFDAESLRPKAVKGRVCGLERRWFWWLMVLLGLLIVAAVVVPVVLVLVPKGQKEV